MNDDIFIISKIWIDPLENRKAYGYDIYGYVLSEEKAIAFCSKGKTYTQKDCWQITDSKPEYIWKRVSKIDNKFEV